MAVSLRGRPPFQEKRKSKEDEAHVDPLGDLVRKGNLVDVDLYQRDAGRGRLVSLLGGRLRGHGPPGK